MPAKVILALMLSSIALTADPLVVGRTRTGRLINAEQIAGRTTDAPVVLLLGGLFGPDSESVRTVREETSRYRQLPRRKRTIRLLSIDSANPEKAAMTFPPPGRAYREHTESHALWRWTGSHAPDLVIIAGEDPFGLAGALSGGKVAGFGSIPSRQVGAVSGILSSLGSIAPSEARRELQRRLARSSIEVVRALEPFYGHDFPEAVYVPGMALIARTRIGSLDDVRNLVEPFRTGAKDSLAKPTASHLSGHLVFAELAEKTKDSSYVDLVRRAADLGFDDDGKPRESMPFHNEMSDAVFMACPLLAKAAKLTGDRKYADMALRHFRYMQSLCRREDGLYRHSPLSPAAWGRGNAFPALGLALTLRDLPPSHPAYSEMLSAFQSLMNRLLPFQDANTGMWRQVIDEPRSYPEFSATAMIGRAALIGILHKWLDARKYQPAAREAWQAVAARVSNDGQVVDVCESTGKQKSLADYFDREAILGRDARGGGMAMMFGLEMAGIQ